MLTIRPFSPSETLAAKHVALSTSLSALGSVLVAFSGGADSALLLKVAHDVLGDRAVAAIAVSPSLPDDELAGAVAVAESIGVTLHRVETAEMLNAAYRRNDADRCYHCKDELFTVLKPLADRLSLAHVVYGLNADDVVSDDRPGQRAALEWGVEGPLAAADLHKDEVRALSRRLGLATWNKPAMACLASRIPHGQEVTMEALSMVEEAERFIRSFGVRDLRVRSHEQTARIEVDAESLPLLVDPVVRARITARLHELGYRYVTLDLDGFRSGSTNASATLGA